jgi:UMF1 family MFS transporter
VADEAAPAGAGAGAPRARIAAWAIYDWANSAFPTVIGTLVFAAYFTQGIAPDPATGTARWSIAISVAGFAVAVAGPLVGAVADHWGPRKPWLGVLTAVSVAASALLWGATPEPSSMLYAMVWVCVGTVAFELGMVFYNAMLPELAPPGKIGRVSGWAWGVGYAGGLSCLAVALVLLVQPDPSPLGLDRDAAEHLRATGPLVAAWYALFALPLFLMVPDAPRTGLGLGAACRKGVVSLIAVFRDARRHAQAFRFLIARMIYTDGLTTLFAFGGIYAAGTFGFGFDELVIFGIAINVTSGLGAAAFAWADDRFGAKPTIAVALVGLIVCGSALLVVDSKTMFWAFGLPLGVFVGPAQAASRSMMARLAPADIRTEMFGLYALSGKATAFLGPAVLGAVTAATDSQRAGMATIVAFLAVGLAGLVFLVKEPKHATPR